MSETETETEYLKPSREDFAALLDENLKNQKLREGQVAKGRITQIENDFAIVDVGLKTEGRVPLNEFGTLGNRGEVNIGDEVDVFVERIENVLGEAVLSCDKARREGAWQDLETAYNEKRNVQGAVLARVKGGFTVDLGGAQAFLPGSQIDVRPNSDSQVAINEVQKFQILKIDRRRNNIVVSRRAVLEEDRVLERNKMIGNLEEGQTVEGIVKNTTEYGAFVDLGGIDGLLHVTQISWKRISDPGEVLQVGQKITVKIIRINNETQRINLSMKHLEEDPWESMSEKYSVGTKIIGRITNTTEYGAFVEIEPGIEGLVHVSEMSWTQKGATPDNIVSINQEVETVVLEVDLAKRRISLGIKQCQENPWEGFLSANPTGTKIKGVIKNITDFGMFVGVGKNLDGMVHISDLSWEEKGEEAIKKYKVGDEVEVVVLAVEMEKERVSLGIKQISSGDISELKNFKRGQTITCTVLETKDSGLDVEIANSGVRGFIRRADLARDSKDQRPERFASDQKVDVKITQLDFKMNKISLSIKALEEEEEKETLKQYGSTDSGASLGDILGSALRFGRRKKDDDETKTENKE